jgi:hypothetical protein
MKLVVSQGSDQGISAPDPLLSSEDDPQKTVDQRQGEAIGYDPGINV